MGSEDDGRLHQPEGWVLAFHPEFLQKDTISSSDKRIFLFSYNANEALHLSEQERKNRPRMYGKRYGQNYNIPSTNTANH